MRLFLTGATGFIGSHVLLAALNAGYEVVAMRRSAHSSATIPLPKEPTWWEGDLNSLEASQLEGIDAIIHTAAAGVSPKRASWSDLLQTNVCGSIRLLESASVAGIRRCVFVGTCHEYGNSALRYKAIPPDAPLEPLNEYGASKAACYQLTRTFASIHELEFFYGRIFFAYGEGQYSHNFWPSLQRAAILGEDLRMTSGRQIGDFIPAETVAVHLLAACTRSDIIPGSPYVVNIGTGIPQSLLAFAEAEWKRLAAKSSLVPSSIPDRKDQIYHMVPDIKGLFPPTPHYT
jgi:UDP-glucose 4-epimerase